MFGRFVPDFGRVVAQMQFDMYHHYTVDEHTIRAIGLLSADREGRAEGGPSARQRHLRADRVAARALRRGAAPRHRQGPRRRPFGAGRRSRERLCPRLGLSPAETETVAWLVRWHLLMSATAFKRDLSDFKTILDFCRARAEPRAAAPAADADHRRYPRGRARACGTAGSASCSPTSTNRAEEVLRLGHKQKGRSERVAAKQEDLAGIARLDRRTHGGAQEKADRALLDRRAARRARAQRPPDRRGGRCSSSRSRRRSIPSAARRW